MQKLLFKTSQVGLHMGVAFSVTFLFTGSLAVGGVAAVVEPICNVLLMPLHDKLWGKFKLRRQQGTRSSLNASALQTEQAVS